MLLAMDAVVMVAILGTCMKSVWAELERGEQPEMVDRTGWWKGPHNHLNALY